MKIDVNSPQFNEVVAQLGHFGWGALLTLFPYVMWHNLWLGPIVVLVWGIPKEFWFDVKVEGQTTKDGIIDLGFYVGGLLLAVLMMVFAK